MKNSQFIYNKLAKSIYVHQTEGWMMPNVGENTNLTPPRKCRLVWPLEKQSGSMEGNLIHIYDWSQNLCTSMYLLHRNLLGVIYLNFHLIPDCGSMLPGVCY